MAGMKVGLSLGGETKKTRPLNEIMSEDSRLGIAEIDRFTTEFDQEANEYVKVPHVTAEPAIELVCNEGKGYGSQTVASVDIPDTTVALQEIIDADFQRPEGDEDVWQPPADVIRNSWRMVHPRKDVRDPKTGKMVTERDKTKPKDYVSFRTRNGRGAKPVEVHKSELASVIALLTNIPAQLDEHSEVLWEDYQTLKSAEEAQAAAEAEAQATGGEE